MNDREPVIPLWDQAKQNCRVCDACLGSQHSGKERREEIEMKAILAYIARPCLKTPGLRSSRSVRVASQHIVQQRLP